MVFRFRLLLDKLDENRLSLFERIVEAANVDDGFKTDANCNRDCRSIDFDEGP